MQDAGTVADGARAYLGRAARTDVAAALEAVSYGGAVMSTEITQQKCVPTSVELLDGAV